MTLQLHQRPRSALSRSDEYGTPGKLYRELDARYIFNRDVAAAPWSAKCARFWTRRDNALRLPWYGRCWMNPPYSKGNLQRWMEKARGEVLRGRAELVGCLVPHYTSEGWWDLVEAPAGELLGTTFARHRLGSTTALVWDRLVVEITRLRGRQGFLTRRGPLSSARFASVLVAFLQPGTEVSERAWT